MLKKRKIALVKNGLYTKGGVSSVCQFLYQTITSVGRYEIQLFSLETFYSSPINVRLLSPNSWIKGVQTVEYVWDQIPIKHVGIFLPEFESQRYMPRRSLTSLLNQFDLVQVVAGSPAPAMVTKNITKPMCLFMASLVKLERKTMLQKAGFPRRIYAHMMMPVVSKIERQAIKRADHIFAETEYTRDAISADISISKISIDTIGVDTHIFHPVPESERTNDFILSVGRFDDPRKNIDLLIEAYALLRHRMRDAPKLILAGTTAPSRSVWAKAGALGLTSHIVFKRSLPVDELVKLYQNAAVYVLSSNEEGLGIVLLEAMACATPVISTRCGGPNSVVSEGVGFLTPVGDAELLVDRMMWMLQNPEKQRILGQAGRKMIEARFSNEVVGKKYLEVYDKLLGLNFN